MAKFADQLMSKEDARKAIKSAATSIIAMRRNLQKVAVSAIGYANFHQDIDIAREVFEQFNGVKGVQAQRLLDYIQHYGCVVFDGKNKKKPVQYAVNLNAECKDVAALLEQLDGAHWYEHKNEKEAEALDVHAELQKLVKRVLKAQEAKREVLHAELVDGVVNLLTPKDVTTLTDAVKLGAMQTGKRLAA